MTNGNDAVQDIRTKQAQDAYGKTWGDTHSKGGLTKREYFAAMAMQGLLSSEDTDSPCGAEAIGRWSVDYADGLIEALNK